jgi:pimeloyl-ACP methyl ester carboxylesterase
MTVSRDELVYAEHSVGTRLDRVRLTEGTVEYASTGHGPPVVLLHGLLMNHTIWEWVLPRLPSGFRYIRPVLPLGGHRIPMSSGADLSMAGTVRLLDDVLAALRLRDVTLVVSDWGGPLLMTALGRDERVARMVILPCEAFTNFPPGLPGRMAVLAARLPGGMSVAARQLGRSKLRRTPLLLGQMAKKPLPDGLVRSWTDGLLRDRGVRRDARRYAGQHLDRERLDEQVHALSRFRGEALVVWSPECPAMPPDHGFRLARLFARGHLVEVHDAYALSMLDQPGVVARHITRFLLSPREPFVGRG